MMKKFVLLVCLFLIPLTLVSETQHRFRIAVETRGKDGNPHIRKYLETHLKRELLSLADVDVVDLKDTWHFMLYVIFAEDKFTGDGLNIAIAERFDERVPRSYFKADRYPPSRSTPVYISGLSVAYYSIDELDDYCAKLVNDIEKKNLTPIRALLR